MTYCKYCENTATKTLVWLFDKKHQPARIKLPWCGCDLMVALKRFWPSPYQVEEGIDYEIEDLTEDTIKIKEAPKVIELEGNLKFSFLNEEDSSATSVLINGENLAKILAKEMNIKSEWPTYSMSPFNKNIKAKIVIQLD